MVFKWPQQSWRMERAGRKGERTLIKHMGSGRAVLAAVVRVSLPQGDTDRLRSKYEMTSSVHKLTSWLSWLRLPDFKVMGISQSQRWSQTDTSIVSFEGQIKIAIEWYSQFSTEGRKMGKSQSVSICVVLYCM